MISQRPRSSLQSLHKDRHLPLLSLPRRASSPSPSLSLLPPLSALCVASLPSSVEALGGTVSVGSIWNFR